jgi:hypothetical protein
MKNAVTNDTAVEMDQRLAGFTFPARDTLAELLVVLADNVIADGVQVSLVGSDCLMRFFCLNAPLLVETMFWRRRACSGCGDGRCRCRP